MNLDHILFMALVIFLSGITIVIVVMISNHSKKEKSKLKKELDEFKQNYIDNISDVGLKIMSMNLLELKEYYIMTKRQYERTFWIATIFSSIGCVIILGGAVYGAINGDYEITKYTVISGGVSEGVATLAFWMFTQAKNQMNLYSEHLKNNEKIICAINILDKKELENKNEIISKIIGYLLGENVGKEYE